MTIETDLARQYNREKEMRRDFEVEALARKLFIASYPGLRQVHETFTRELAVNAFEAAEEFFREQDKRR